MKAPRIPSVFKNIKKDHRKFQFRSPHYKSKDKDLEQRRRRLESEVARERGEEVVDVPRRVTFDRRRRTSRRRHGYMAMLRTLIILIVLVYLLYKGIQWAETTDFSRVLKTIQDG